MAQKKNKYGLTPLEERFCHEVVDGTYSADGGGVLVTAYRKAANCYSEGEKPKKWHYERASRLASDSKINARIAQIEDERNKALTLSHSEFVSTDIWLNDFDVLDLMMYDKKINAWRLRKIYEMTKEVRQKVPFKIDSKGRMVPDLDKNVVRDRLMKALGFNSDKKDINVNVSDGVKVIEFGDFPDSLWESDDDKK